MHKERRAKIPNEFPRKDTELLAFIKLRLDLSAALQDTVDCIQMIKTSHKDFLQKVRHSNTDPPVSLRGVIDPLVISFTEGKLCQLVKGQGPSRK
ncbi:hypothetical protein RMCBS344292_01833 [Rhizopus microsporus]|nr:hypothetical protein RMCBS344292_01833 [Rhizopus microsporus]